MKKAAYLFVVIIIGISGCSSQRPNLKQYDWLDQKSSQSTKQEAAKVTYAVSLDKIHGNTVTFKIGVYNETATTQLGAVILKEEGAIFLNEIVELNTLKGKEATYEVNFASGLHIVSFSGVMMPGPNGPPAFSQSFTIQ